MESIETRLFAGKFGNPGMILKRGGENFIFDCGDGLLSKSDFNKLKAVFISHHHYDHFSGFDPLIPLSLYHENPIKVIGPEGNIQRVIAKVMAYNWNLIKEDDIKLDVYEIIEDKLLFASLRFPFNLDQKYEIKKVDQKEVLNFGDYKIRFTSLDHSIPSIAYAFSEKDYVNIDKQKLLESGLNPGAWLEELKVKFNQPRSVIDYFGEYIETHKLIDMVVLNQGRKIVYATDFIYSVDNIGKLLNIAKGADEFYCEANFLSSEHINAKENYHLTAGQAGMLASELGVKKLVLFHHSRRYNDGSESVISKSFISEASRYFKGEIC